MKWPKWITGFGLSILIVAACYLPALDGEPITEDRLLILENPATRSPWAALASFTRSFWHGIMPVQPYYRPLPILTWSIERSLAGPTPSVFHATNIALHGLNAALAALLVLGLARLAEPEGARLGASSLAVGVSLPGVAVADGRPPAFITTPLAGALLAGALVAVHPLHSEPVAALYGRPDLLATAGTLLFLNFAVRGRWILSLVALAAALLSKESALLMPLLIPAAFAAGAVRSSIREFTRGRAAVELRDSARARASSRVETGDRPGQGTDAHRAAASTRLHKSGLVAPALIRPLRVAVVGSFAAALVLGGYLILRYVALGALVDRPPIHPLDNPLVRAIGIERWLTPLAVLARTARIGLWPDSLCADRGYATVPLASGIGDPWALAGGALLLAALVVVARLWVLRSPWALPATATLLAWLPASNLIVMAPVLMAERLAYMPSIFICVLAGGACVGLAGGLRSNDVSTPASREPALRAGGITGRAGPAARARARRRGLISAVVIVMTLALAALAGRTFVRASDFRSEISFYESDTRACPLSVKAHYNLGNALSRESRHEEAVQAFERATGIAPFLAIAHSNRGGSYLAMNRIGEAEAAYRQALEVDPGLVTARASLAGILYLKGQLEAALTEAESALASNPAPGDAVQIRELIDRIRKRLAKLPEAAVLSEARGQPLP